MLELLAAWEHLSVAHNPFRPGRHGGPELPIKVLGADRTTLLEEIVARERAARGWASHVTAVYLMEKWLWLVTEVEQGSYQGLVEEYANDLDSRKLLGIVVNESPPDIAAKLLQWAAPLDERFTSATVRATGTG